MQANEAFLNYYRCPEVYADFNAPSDGFAGSSGYFRFGSDLICYGESNWCLGAASPTVPLSDVLGDISIEGSTCRLPFQPTQLVDNLRFERYVSRVQESPLEKLARAAYYLLRPGLPVAVRRHLQRAWLNGREKTSFPSWPVDWTADRILERLMALSLKAKNAERIPFIWFWPDGHRSCAMITHDVETEAGLRFSPSLMDIDDSFEIKTSFQIIPEERYSVPQDILSAMRERGFEINVHDLNHDGDLFRERSQFLQRASRINHYVREYGAKGFRSGALYRNPDWYDAFAFSYDMSVPNVGHLDPQRGGCCTVMPYFIGNIVELPLTTTQDYSLFHILGNFSTDLWKQQISLILEKHGLISFIIHPDYIIQERPRKIYIALLEHLSQLRSEANIWMPIPGDVDAWWRQRSQMRLRQVGGTWRIEGPGKERARVAWATVAGEEVLYAIDETS